MKFTINVLGADSGLIERLTAAANRKLALQLRRLAMHHARRAHAALHHHTAISHPVPTHHATSHRVAARHATSHPSISRALEAAVLGGVLAGVGRNGGQVFAPDAAPLDVTFDAGQIDLSQDPVGAVASDAPSAISPDGSPIFDVSLDSDIA